MVEPSRGEVNAVVGFGGQFELAARVVLAKLPTLEWIRVADPQAGVADDFQFKSGPRRHALQVKWSQPAGTFTWSDLTSGEKDKPGLLTKLADAWRRLKPLSSDPLTVYLCTNNLASSSSSTGNSPIARAAASGPHSLATFVARSFEPVQLMIRSGTPVWSDLSKIPEVEQWAPVWTALRDLTGLTDDEFVSFVGDFEMKFGLQLGDPLMRPDQDPSEGEVGHLAQTLQNIVRDPAQPTHLTRDDLMHRLGWSERLRYRHPHQFPVPAVYTTNEAARTGVESLLNRLTGGYIALVGPAGSGKSSLLTNLRFDGHLARYYAFVPDAPDPLSSRGEADSYLHDVSLALEESGLPRQGIGNDLPTQRAVLFRQLDDAGRRWTEREERTVIVIDGLDHIPREQRPSRSLLEELPPPAALPNGVFVVLGTQTTSILPSPIQTALNTQERTVALPPLSTEEVERVTSIAGLTSWLYPGQVTKVAEASEGHPLALTYILQELKALETSEPDTAARRERAERLLADASGYGGDIESRYQGYVKAIGTDQQVRNLLGMVARLRVPVNLQWLSTWADPHAVSVFADQAATFFRRSDDDWQFIHNSFRSFLSDETAKVAGRIDEARNRQLHQQLADVCAGSGDEWSMYRDEEVVHRFLAEEHNRVLALATPDRLRQSLVELRPSTTVRDHALIALRSATLVDDASSFMLMLMFLNELHLRGYVLESDKLAAAVFSFDSQLALEHIVRGGRLRIEPSAALKIAVDFAVAGDVDAAQRIVRACGGLAGLTDNRTSPDTVANWAEVTWRLSGLEAVRADLDHHLPPPRTRNTPSTGGTEPDEVDDDDDTRACRNWVHARCCDLLAEVRDDEALDELIAIIDSEATPDWRARARFVRAKTASEDKLPLEVLRWVREIVALDASGSAPDDEDDEDDLSSDHSAHAVSLNIRGACTELLIRHGFSDAPEVSLLLPPGTRAAWPGSLRGQEGLKPFSTLIVLNRIRHVLPDPTGDDPMPPRERSTPRDAGSERFRRALRALATVEGQRLAAAAGLGESPSVAAHAGPIIRLLEVPVEQTRDWTDWYIVRDAALDLIRRVVRHAGEIGGTGVTRQLELFEDAWTTPDRSRYWIPERQQAVIIAAIDAHPDARSWALGQLERLDDVIDTRSSDSHDRVALWLAQARAWASAGEIRSARRAAQSAVRVSLGVDSSDHDRQIGEWLDWLEVAAEQNEVSSAQLEETARRYAIRIASVASTAAEQAGSAAEKLIALTFPYNASLGCELAEWLCDSGALAEASAIQAVVLAACRHPDIPITSGVAAATELLYPIIREPSGDIFDAVHARHTEDPDAIAALRWASRLWTVRETQADATSTDADGELSPGAHAESSDASPVVESIGALLTQLRRAESAADGPRGGWDEAVQRTATSPVPAATASTLLDQATRLGLGGAALGGLVALAARSGASTAAAKALTDALSRTPGYGWLRHYDGGTRLNVFSAALRDRHPRLVEVARNDLANSLTSGSLSGQMSPDNIRRVVELVAGPRFVAGAWPDIEAYLDVAIPVDEHSPGPAASSATIEPHLAFARWVAAYLGHPIRPLDFGARRTLQIIRCHDEQVGQLVLCEAILNGGWIGEAALLSLITTPPADRASKLIPDLAAAVQEAAIGADGLCRDLARRAALLHSVEFIEPEYRSLPGSYALTLPALSDRAAPELDRHGTPHLDLHDAQQLVAPFDLPLRLLAELAGLDESAVLHRAATIARASDARWVNGGHHGQASLLKARQQMHTYRPWAYMVGRRALGHVLAELDDADVLEPVANLLAYYIGLVDERLAGIAPVPVSSWIPLPRPEDTPNYDTKGWCSEASQAAQQYKDEYSCAPVYVLAELGQWCRLEWGKPEEERQIHATHHESRGGLLVPKPPAWETCWTGAYRYPFHRDLEWSHEELVLHGYESWTDAEHMQWLALHPMVGQRLGWNHDPEDLFTWTGGDGAWRARTVLQVRGQLSHQPLMHSECAEIRQVQLSEAGYAELKSAFPSLARSLVVTRRLPASRRQGRPEETHSDSVVLIDTPPSGKGST
nr:hypothetical protein [Rhodococcus sp. JVH1]EJJ01628.1 hypothetical protein JVH1_0775 [Rhodococcus sp. JVH1]